MAIHDKDAPAKNPATVVDPFQAYISSFRAPGAGIDIPQFQTDFLSPAPEAPVATTQGDPFNNALAVFGAGLAAPIGPDQTFQGNTAKAALAGLDVIDNARRDINAQAQTEFNNTIAARGVSSTQGGVLVNAHQANLQRDYYTGLIRNAGLDSFLDKDGKADDRVLQAAELSEKIFKTTVEFVNNLYTDDEIKELYPAGMGAIFADVFTMIQKGMGLPETEEAIRFSIRQQDGYNKLKKLYAKAGVPDNILPANVEDFLRNEESYVAIYKKYLNAQKNPPRTDPIEAAILKNVSAEGRDDPAVQTLANQFVAMTPGLDPEEALKMAFKQIYGDKDGGGTN